MKRRILSILSVFMVLAMLFSISSCVSDEPVATEEPTEAPTVTETPTQKPTEKPTKKKDPINLDLGFYKSYDIVEDYEHFKLYGRTSEVDDGISCDFTASGIEFEGIIAGDVTLYLSCDRNTYFTVYIDGVRAEERFFATPSTTELLIASFDEDSEDFHNIRVLKQTEPQWSMSVLKRVSLKGELYEAPANKDLYIEIIGDSITCGYGNLNINGTSDAGALYQDGTKSYGFMTAEALGADCSIVGCSGIGIDKGWTEWSEKDFYPMTSYYRDKTSNEYDFSVARVPDIVIINLGTNDNSRGSTEEEFKKGVKDLINYVRDSYGEDMPIVWAYNMMGACRYEWTSAVIDEMGGEDAGIYSVRLEQNNGGGKGHPTEEAHVAAAETLTTFIQEEVLVK